MPDLSPQATAACIFIAIIVALYGATFALWLWVQWKKRARRS